MADKLRVHQLARELGVDSKTILAKCNAEDVHVKNHMSTVSAGLAATIREWFSVGSTTTATEVADPVDLEKVRKKTRRKKKTDAPEVKELDETADEEADHEPDSMTTTSDATAVAEGSLATEAAEPSGDTESTGTEEISADALVAESTPQEVEAKEAQPIQTEEEIEPETIDEPDPVKPVGETHIPKPAKLQGPRVIRMEAPDQISKPRRSASPRHRPPAPAGADLDVAAVAPTDAAKGRRGRATTYHGTDESEEAKKARKRRPARGTEVGEQLREWRDRDLEERQQRLKGATGRRAKRRASESATTIERRAITQAQVTEPIAMKNFCAATGLSFVQLTPRLVSELKIIPNINMVLEREMAELLAAEYGIELTIVKAKSPLDDIRVESQNRKRDHLETRAPVVTFLGHVDHGKTSLLDLIRHTRVAAGEAGGITQHMGSYHLNREGLAVTFLDTPGHEAFTAMRARGAQMTDVVVLVIAADDGVMPQTIEAINHAKAAGVPIVVALNKIDIPGIDTNKIYGQLSEYDLAPSEWGGSTDVIKTSATQNIGIDELVEHLSTLSEILELTADPTVPARGRVIEAEMKPGVGISARVLVQDGTLRRGDIVVCGCGFGKIRAIRDHANQELNDAGPSMPVEIWGLDALPNAGDELYAVESLKRAEQIAEEVKHQIRRDSLSTFSKPATLEDLFGQRKTGEIPELNVIVKADVQGSVDVLRKSLSEFPADEVKLNILHSGVGAILESDVLLAEASNAIVIGFQVVADTKVRHIADEKQVDVRNYRVIYDVMDDIKKALEGLLEPEEKIEIRGLAEVREIFRVSKAGMIAGCFVREGTVSKNHKARVIRDGVVVRDKANLASLRRFKDDAREVKAGFECGIKLEGFDDIKPNDSIETYEIIKVARTL